MYRFLRLIRYLFRAIVNQKHPGKQIIMSLALLLGGGLVCFFSALFIAQSNAFGSSASPFLPMLAIVSCTIALLGLLTLPEGIVHACVRGWDGRRGSGKTKLQSVSPKPPARVPPGRENHVVPSSFGRRTSQGKQKKRAGRSM